MSNYDELNKRWGVKIKITQFEREIGELEKNIEDKNKRVIEILDLRMKDIISHEEVFDLTVEATLLIYEIWRMRKTIKGKMAGIAVQRNKI